MHFSFDTRALEQRDTQRRVARAAIRSVDWLTACQHYAGLGFHSMSVASTSAHEPWNTALDSELVSILENELLPRVAEALGCAVTQQLHIGDFAVALSRAHGVVLLNWATLEDARSWMQVNNDETHCVRVAAAGLVTQFPLKPTTTPSCMPLPLSCVTCVAPPHSA